MPRGVNSNREDEEQIANRFFYWCFVMDIDNRYSETYHPGQGVVSSGNCKNWTSSMGEGVLYPNGMESLSGWSSTQHPIVNIGGVNGTIV